MQEDHDLAKKSIPTGSQHYTAKQGQYLAFIYYYTKVNGRPPAEADMQRFFNVSPPSVHRMLVELEKKQLIRRTPRQPRSITTLVQPSQLPTLQ
jgi:Mn-dependent DtxR family transcriptional regulator